MTASLSRADRYRQLLPRYPGVSRTVLWTWAGGDSRSTWPGLEWEQLSTILGGTFDVAWGQIDGFGVHVDAAYDHDPQIWGRFTDTWVPAAIQNPGWRRSDRDVFKWYVPDEGGRVAEVRDTLRRAGYSRHDAYTQAVAGARATARREAEPDQYIVRATVRRGNVTLGHAEVYGFDPGEEEGEARRDQFIGQAAELIREALHDAGKALAALVPDPQPVPQPHVVTYNVRAAVVELVDAKSPADALAIMRKRLMDAGFEPYSGDPGDAFESEKEA